LQHASRRDPPFVRLGHAAIFGYEEDNGFQESSASGRRSGEFRKGRQKPTTNTKREVIEETKDYLGVVGLAASAGHLVVPALCLAPVAGTSLGVLGLDAGFFSFGPLHRTGHVILN
jgi:hypothetical protein